MDGCISLYMIKYRKYSRQTDKQITLLIPFGRLPGKLTNWERKSPKIWFCFVFVCFFSSCKWSSCKNSRYYLTPDIQWQSGSPWPKPGQSGSLNKVWSKNSISYKLMAKLANSLLLQNKQRDWRRWRRRRKGRRQRLGKRWDTNCHFVLWVSPYWTRSHFIFVHLVVLNAYGSFACFVLLFFFNCV